MGNLRWGDEYRIGIDEIDEQHKEFVNIINKLYWAEANRYGRDIGTRLVAELLKYAEFHFVCEENLMYLHRFPGLPGQVAEHQKLLGIMQMKMKEFQAGTIDYDAVAKFAFMWLISHTTEEDRKFGEFMKRQQAR